MTPSDLFVMGGAYLVGSVPSGLWVARRIAGWDVRERGSGNIGATNVLREAGVVPGLLTLGLDVGKGAAAVLAARAMASGASIPDLAGLAAMLGHVFPPWLGFRGGKGAATGAGAWGVLHPASVAVAVVAFAVAVGITRRVSIGTLVAAILLPVLVAWSGGGTRSAAIAAAASLLILWSHRANMQRLRTGTEPRIGRSARAGAPGGGAGTK